MIADEVLGPSPELQGPSVPASENKGNTFGGCDPILTSRVSFEKLDHCPDSFVELLSL